MNTSDGSVMEPHVRRTSKTPEKGLTFPKSLIHPPQSQVSRSEDAVSNRVSQLDMWAQRLGEGFGISFTSFTLNPLESSLNRANLAIAMLAALAYRDERVSLERRSGRWGLFFTREPALIANERRAETVLLKDAPLDVRERFLQKSEYFFREYLKLCEDRLGRMKGSVEDADSTLELLGTLRLE